MKHETDSIIIEVDFDVDEGGCMEMVTRTKVKDPEIYPPLNLEDKKFMETFRDAVYNQQRSLLMPRKMQGDVPRKGVQMLNVTCVACGTHFQAEAPPCGNCDVKADCPECGKKLTLHIGKKNSG